QAANTAAKVSTPVFAPEARWRLAGGGTTGAKPVEPPSPGGATDQHRSIAPPGLESMESQSQWLPPLLISSGPPGRRVIPDLCRNFRPALPGDFLSCREAQFDMSAPERRRHLLDKIK